MTSFTVTHRVLVVDDEQVLAGTVANHVDLAGFDARAVHTGPDALAIIRGHGYRTGSGA